MSAKYRITVSKAAPQDLKNKEFPNWAMSYNECSRYLNKVCIADQMWFHILPVEN